MSSNKRSNPILNHNEAKEHYESLTKYLKYGLTFISVCTTLLLGVGGYVFFVNGQDLREGLEKQREGIEKQNERFQDQIKYSQAQLEHKEELMEKKVAELGLTAREEIKYSREQAIKEIAEIKNVATSEAIKRIDETFRERNIEEFIVKATDKTLKPYVENYLTKQRKKFEDIEQDKINQAIISIQSNNSVLISPGVNYLAANPSIDLTDEQIKKLTSIDLTYWEEKLISTFYSALVYRKPNKDLTAFLKAELIKDRTSFGNGDADARKIYIYLMQEGNTQDIPFYINSMTRNKPKEYGGAIINLTYYARDRNNKKLVLEFLNDKQFVDVYFGSDNVINSPNKDIMRTALYNELSSIITKSEFEKTYYYKQSM